MTKATNTTSVFELSNITDTNEHDLPDTDGDDKASAEEPYDVRSEDRAAVYVTNLSDQSLTARLERANSLDQEFNEPADDVTGVSVAANGQDGDTVILAADPDIPLAYLRIVISYDTAPSGSDPSLRATYQSDRNGDS
jgi:hypothetical protein